MQTSPVLSTASVFIRSFLIQAFWNFERIQNVGFAFCIYPFLVRIYPDKEKRTQAIMRHLEFFCTHPYMVNILLGLVVSLEEKLAQGDPQVNEKMISQIKSHLAGPLAALGDSFFWVTWRTLSVAAAASVFFFAGDHHETSLAIFAVAIFLMFFNMLHIPVRWFGFSIAYKEGVQVIATIERFRVLNWGRLISPVIIIWTLLMVIAYFIVHDWDIWQRIMLGGFFIGLFAFKQYDVSTIKMFYMTMLICVLLSFIGFA